MLRDCVSYRRAVENLRSLEASRRLQGRAFVKVVLVAVRQIFEI